MHIKNWLLPSRKKRSQEPLWDYWNEDPQQEDTTRGRSSSRRSRRKDREELSNHFGYGVPPHSSRADEKYSYQTDEDDEESIFREIIGQPLMSGRKPTFKERKSWGSSRSRESSRVRRSISDTWQKMVPRKKSYYRMQELA